MGIVLNKLDLDDDIQDKILNDLIVPNPAYVSAIERGNRPVLKKNGRYVPIPKSLHFVRETPTTIEVPLGYLDELNKIMDVSEWLYSPKPVQDTSITLRSYQKEAVETLLQYNTGILDSPAASGKTIMGLAIVEMLQLKTLWVVHRAGIARQAIKAGTKYFNLGKVGLLGDKKWEFGDLLTTAVTKTAAIKKHILKEENFELIIVDEVHRAPTKFTFEAILEHTPKIIYGLSATPYREDGLEQALYYMIGPIRHHVPREILKKDGFIITPSVEFVQTGIRIDLDALDKVSFGAYINALFESKERMLVLLENIADHVLKGRKCLVLAEYTDHIVKLYNMLSKFFPGQVGIVSGKYKKLEKTISNEIKGNLNIIVTTYRYFSDGFDLPELESLFFTTPFKSLIQTEQVVGRVQRPGKTKAYVVDFVDDDPIARKHLPSRITIYKKLGVQGV